MVPPARRLTVSLSLLLSCTVTSVGVSVATHTRMEQADNGRTDSNAESTASSGKLVLHSFPNENPSELELRRWIESAQDRLRAARLLPYALSNAPTATTEYAAKNLIPNPPTGTAETITNGILSKNMQITADNADRVIAWASRVRDKNDTIAAALQLSLRSNAPGRLAALERAHAMTAPNEHMLNGGAMFRALKGLQGHLDTEEEAKLAKKQVDFFLDPKGRLGDNVSANQFDERVNEFDVHVNPALEMQYNGLNYSKFLLQTCIPPCLETDGRLLRRELEAASRMGDVAHVRAEIKKLLSRAHDPEKPLPVVPGLRNTVMAMRCFVNKSPTRPSSLRTAARSEP